MHIAIVGFGCAGRVSLLTLINQYDDLSVDVFDQNSLDSKLSCGYAAAGMVAPISEAVSLAENTLYTQGIRSLALWPQLLSKLGDSNQFYHQTGTLVVAHYRDEPDFSYFNQQMSNTIEVGKIKWISKRQLCELESTLSHSQFHHQALYFPEECCINVKAFYKATNDLCLNSDNITFYQKKIEDIQALSSSYDYVIDTRGLSNYGLTNRGIRGEAVVVQAPDVAIRHTIRLIHPRHPIYITPRGNGVYYVGATSIESHDQSEISVKSTLELLSALYTVDKGFAEARIIKLIANIRPANRSGIPELSCQRNIYSISGLNRHGYLLSPVLAEKIRLNINEKYESKSYAS
ncbi:FAD-binding oxidoreductase [Francisellaceae bacterium]|nr:FAD-binding oxidoreductase [Francisellaceae bacterium]